MSHSPHPAPHHLVIVGSGPAALTAAIYSARAGLEPIVLASSVAAGGELTKTTEVENFPGFPEGIQGPALMDQMIAQAARFGARILHEDVTGVSLAGEIKTVTVGGGGEYRARAVILATGSEYRRLGLPGEEELTGHGVSWCATCDGFFFRDRDVVVVGGGDSAMEEATFLTRFARSVTVVHRRGELRASRVMQDRALAHPKITFLWEHEVAALRGEGALEGIDARSVVTGEITRLDCAGLFVAVGNDPRVELCHGQLALTAAGTIAVEGRSSRTGLPGVFAAGDVVDAEYRQAITAAASGCTAALDAERFLADLDDGEGAGILAAQAGAALEGALHV